jgi:hypothetical protein
VGRPSVLKKAATAFPTDTAISTVIRYSLANPLIPSVPKSFWVIEFFLLTELIMICR